MIKLWSDQIKKNLLFIVQFYWPFQSINVFVCLFVCLDTDTLYKKINQQKSPVCSSRTFFIRLLYFDTSLDTI